MCLAVPIKLVEIKNGFGIVEKDGIKRKVNISLLENPQIGDYLIVHAGFAISVVDEEEALNTLNLLKEIIQTDN